MSRTPVRTISIKEDVGSHEPAYRTTVLQLWSDGSVTWLSSEADSAWTTDEIDKPQDVPEEKP